MQRNLIGCAGARKNDDTYRAAFKVEGEKYGQVGGARFGCSCAIFAIILYRLRTRIRVRVNESVKQSQATLSVISVKLLGSGKKGLESACEDVEKAGGLCSSASRG